MYGFVSVPLPSKPSFSKSSAFVMEMGSWSTNDEEYTFEGVSILLIRFETEVVGRENVKRISILIPTKHRILFLHPFFSCKHSPPNHKEARPLMLRVVLLHGIEFYSLKLHSKNHLIFFYLKIEYFLSRIVNETHISQARLIMSQNAWLCMSLTTRLKW